METPSKFMALSYSKGKSVANRYDRLIELPEHVIHHIISFLGANDIARLSFASKRYQQICVSSPYLYFDVNFGTHECDTKCQQFKEFLSKFLRLRGGLWIHWLRLRWLCDSCEHSGERPYVSWICDALRCDVQELDIGCQPGEQNCFTLPIPAASYVSLRVLKLNLQDCCIKNLFSATFASLEVLSLQSLVVDGGLLEAWISTNCTSIKRLNLEAIGIADSFSISTTSSLEELTMHSCSVYYHKTDDLCKISIKGSSLKNVTTSDCIFGKTCGLDLACSSLENLTIHGCSLAYDSYISIACPLLQNLTIQRCVAMESFSIAVSAEQLQTLSVRLSGVGWDGLIFKVQSQNWTSLQDANVEFIDLVFFYIDKDMCNSVLSAVRYARVLRLSIQIIEVLLEKDNVQILFENLHDLVIICPILEVCQMVAIACFLMRAPNLRTLTISYEQKSSVISETDVKEDLAKLLPLAVKHYQLKHGNSENLLLGDQLLKLKISLLNENIAHWQPVG